MKKIESYLSRNEAIESLDNGGRFYNLLTKAEDGVISKSELGKVAGLFQNSQKMTLFLEMSLSKLSETDKRSILDSLEPNLRKLYKKYEAQRLLPSEASQKGILSSNAIITGFPKLIDSKSDFSGFIMVPIASGKVTTFVMIPIIDEYEIYEIRDELTSKSFLIAHSRGDNKLPESRVIIGGVLKEISTKKDKSDSKEKFLEANYYMEA